MPRIAIVAAEFNKPLVDGMVEAARAEAKAKGAEVVREHRVPGSYEIPLVVAKVIERKDVDLVVVLGYIERGETQHGEVMGHVVHGALVSIQLSVGKPIGIGIIGPGATADQATQRRDSYAKSAVAAALASHEVLASMGDQTRRSAGFGSEL